MKGLDSGFGKGSARSVPLPFCRLCYWTVPLLPIEQRNHRSARDGLSLAERGRLNALGSIQLQKEVPPLSSV
jgi:hypothetical protein